LFDEGVVIVVDWVVEANGSIAIGQVATFKASFIRAHNFLKLLAPLELEIFTSFLWHK
jgi:phage antirepressor YoqD-like protein